MIPYELLQQLRSRNIRLWVDDKQRLLCSAPQDALTTKLREQITTHKMALIAILQKAEGLTHSQVPQLIRKPRDRPFPLSFAQQRLWFLDRLQPNNKEYYCHFVIDLVGSLQEPILISSLQELVRRHETLRTAFPEIDGEPVQFVSPPTPLQIERFDLRNVTQEMHEEQIGAFVKQFALEAYDLSQGPLVRYALIYIDENRHLLVVGNHHIVCDGWSTGICQEELLTLYAAFAAGQSSPLPELLIQYADYAIWQREWLQGDILEREVAYWRKRLADAPPLLALPTDHPRPPIPSYQGDKQYLQLESGLVTQMKALSHQDGVTTFMILLAMFQVLLAHYTGQNDVLVGIPIANRTRAEIEPLVGFFPNTLVMRTDLSGDPTAHDLLARVRATSLEAYEHQYLPFEQVVEFLAPKRELSYHPVVQVSFDLHNTQSSHRIPEIPGLIVNYLNVETLNNVTFDLSVEVNEILSPAGDQELLLVFFYAKDLFDDLTITRMLANYRSLLTTLVKDPSLRLSELVPCSEGERQQLLVEWTDTDAAGFGDSCFPVSFRSQVERTPDAVALFHGEAQLTYAELNVQARRLAHQLSTTFNAYHVGSEPIVAVLTPRGIPLLIAQLAIFMAGGGYLPLDPATPSHRLGVILAQSGARLVLVCDSEWDRLNGACAILPVDQRPFVITLAEWMDTEIDDAHVEVAAITVQQLAYVIYTSGSTGLPKGAMITHQGMANHLAAKVSELALASCDRVAQTATQVFDISIWQSLAVLYVGGCVHIIDDKVVYDPWALQKQVDQQGITILEIVPALLQAILAADPQSTFTHSALRWLVVTGETLPPALCRQWFARSHIPLLNAYGPTECSDDVTHQPITARPPATAVHVPIGHPLPNTYLYVLDAHLQPVPIGVMGELYVGGLGVGRGYLNDPGRTATAFLPNPYARTRGARMYRTGDRVRWLPDGRLEFFERIDDQVKVRGFRIELGEIEATLQRHPGLRDCIVVAREDSVGNKYLAAYVIASQQTPPSPNNLRAFLQESLPAYMVPSAFCFLDTWPLTQNGKVDRQALPNLTRDNQTSIIEYVPAHDSLEAQLVQIWEELLQQHPIGIKDNFFELGGHSLLAIQLLTRLEQRLGRTFPLASLFQRTTIEAMAKHLRHESTGTYPSSLIKIQPGVVTPPFFCIHPAGGTILCYYQLAQALGPEQPFYGLQAPSLEGGSAPFTSLEEMASFYIDILQAAQPTGPYLLGGWSLGGCVAFEMAQQLLQQGQKVTLLALIDSWVPEPSPILDEASLLLGFVQDLLVGRVAMPNSLPLHLTTDTLPALYEWAREMNIIPLDLQLEQIQRLFQVFKANVSAYVRYKPQPLATHITFFHAKDATSSKTEDASSGWESLASAGIDRYSIPGDHFSIVNHPHALARELKNCLSVAYQQIESEGNRKVVNGLDDL